MKQQKNNNPVVALMLGSVCCTITFSGLQDTLIGLLVGLPCGIVGLVIVIQAQKEDPCEVSMAALILAIIVTVIFGLKIIACVCVIASLAQLRKLR
ncbi:MAG: hypothetical protein HFE68_03815 [Erysipelotrichaceae bacterium]|nr:hypothetical protein [Erysipelotrichaceae bacterium]